MNRPNLSSAQPTACAREGRDMVALGKGHVCGRVKACVLLIRAVEVRVGLEARAEPSELVVGTADRLCVREGAWLH